MKKFLLGFLLGTILPIMAVACAYRTPNSSQPLKIKPFSANIHFNADVKKVNDGYTLINYNGHVYAPIRFVAENMGATVHFDHYPSTKENSISILYATPNPKDLTLKDDKGIVNVRITEIISQPNATHTQVLGQVMLNKTDYKSNSVNFKVNFYDKNGRLILGELTGVGNIRVGQILPFFMMTLDPRLQKENIGEIKINDVVIIESK